MEDQFEQVLLGDGDLRLRRTANLFLDNCGSARWPFLIVSQRSRFSPASSTRKKVIAWSKLSRFWIGFLIAEITGITSSIASALCRGLAKLRPFIEASSVKFRKDERLSASGVVGLGAVLTNEIVRVLPVRKHENFDLKILRQQGVRSPVSPL